MKTTNNYKILALTAVLFTVLMVSFVKIASANQAKIAEDSISLELSEHESFIGNSEFYLKPAGDDRIWHVINSYISSGSSDDSEGMNNSCYIFSNDSVLVINKYVVDSENDKLNFALVGTNSKQINN
jgi:hypothetical protein